MIELIFFNCNQWLLQQSLRRVGRNTESSIKYIRKIFQKFNVSYFLIGTVTCAYQRVRAVSFSEDFSYVLNGWTLTIPKFGEIPRNTSPTDNNFEQKTASHHGCFSGCLYGCFTASVSSMTWFWWHPFLIWLRHKCFLINRPEKHRWSSGQRLSCYFWTSLPKMYPFQTFAHLKPMLRSFTP